MMNLSPLDGRYYGKLKPLVHLSDDSMLVHKVILMSTYAFFICEVTKKVKPEDINKLSKYEGIEARDKLIADVRFLEEKYGHEMYAAILFVQREFETMFGKDAAAMVNFGLTSEDIVNVSLRIPLQDYVTKTLVVHVSQCMAIMREVSKNCENMLMLGMTHGQPATPVNPAHVLTDFANRLNACLRDVVYTKLQAKFGGATGGRRAHKELLPNAVLSWDEELDGFIKGLGLEPIRVASQINPNDDLSRLFGQMVSLNAVLMDICRDMWLYNMRGVFRMEKALNKVGSTAMPHKVNPIEFENAEGNLGMSTAIFQHMMEKLPVSRMQRDLSDSTVLRNLAVPFAHQFLAIDSMIQGFFCMNPDEEMMRKEMAEHPETDSELELARLKLSGAVDAHDQLRKKYRS